MGFFLSSLEEEEEEEVVDMERAKLKEEGVDVPVNAVDCACDDPNRQGRRAHARRICILRVFECILLILMLALRLLLKLAACMLLSIVKLLLHS